MYLATCNSNTAPATTFHDIDNREGPAEGRVRVAASHDMRFFCGAKKYRMTCTVFIVRIVLRAPPPTRHV